jgi:type IV secretion system protein VirB1
VNATIATMTFGALLAACAPRIGTITMRSIVTYESGGRPYAIGDNSARRSYFPRRRRDAVELARTLVDLGHDLDLGYAQINMANVRAYGLDLAAAFDPCTNLRVGSTILRDDYARAAARYGRGQVALVHALSAYNTGGFFAGLGYARGVYAVAATLRYARR